MGLKRSIFVILSSALLTVVGSCIKEIELDQEDNVSYIFIDGNIVVGEDLQDVFIGRTNGVGTAVPIPVRRAIVTVKDHTAGAEYVYEETSSGEYAGQFLGTFGRNYQLFIEFETGEVFSSDTIRLEAEPTLTFAGSVDAMTRVSAEGDSVVTNNMTATVDFQVPSSSSTDLLVLRSKFEYAISDLVCGPFDGAVKCYYKDDITVDRFGIVDLSRFRGGENGTLQIGSYGIDARMAEESVMLIEIFRAAEQAKPYYRSIASSVSLGSNFFSPQPLTIPGNVVETQNGNGSALGYFGVIERTTLVLPANSNEIIERSGLPFCSGGTASFLRFNCCFCFSNEGASPDRPIYWP